MATKLQTYEIKQLLKKYGNISYLRGRSGGGWYNITVGPRTKYSANRKVEFLALRQVKQQIYHDMLSMTRVIENS